MIATRKILFEKTIYLYDSIVCSQKNNCITNNALFCFENLCKNYVKEIAKFANKKETEDIYYYAISLCLKNYNKFNPKHSNIKKGREEAHCVAYFKTIIRHKLI